MTCITHDPRMDSQVESRCEYYASLALEVELPVGLLEDHIRQGDDTELALNTLTSLAVADYGTARDFLSDYLGWGPAWDWPLMELTRIANEQLLSRLARIVEERFPTSETLDAAMLMWGGGESFARLSACSERIAASGSKIRLQRNSSEAPPLPELLTLSPAELLSLAKPENHRHLGQVLKKVVRLTDMDLLVSHVSFENPYVSAVALAGLEKLSSPLLLPWLLELWSKLHDGERPSVIIRQGVLRILLALPAETTLPPARRWIFEVESSNHSLAKKLLEAHATVEDIPVLRDALRLMLTNEDEEWDCFLIKAFFRFPNLGIVPELVEIYHQFRFSFGRGYAAEAIQITSPDLFRSTLALECLWDCEEGNRLLGIKFAPLESVEVRNRLQFLASSPLEEADARFEAKKRLE